jgi:hypothetical protein
MRSSCLGGLPVHADSNIAALQTKVAMDFIVAARCCETFTFSREKGRSPVVGQERRQYYLLPACHTMR